MRYEPGWVVFLQFPGLQPSVLSGYRGMQTILAGGKLPTAMIATNDLVANGVKDALAVAGIEVPKRMSVMGFDDLGADTQQWVTTMRTDSAEVGRLAVLELLEQIRGGRPSQTRVTVPTELIIRNSTAPVYNGKEGADK
jgi:LacI family transcriptional regulator